MNPARILSCICNLSCIWQGCTVEDCACSETIQKYLLNFHIYVLQSIWAIIHTMVEIRNQCFRNLLLPCILHHFSRMSHYSTLKIDAESLNYQIPWHLILEDSNFEVIAHFHQFSMLSVHCYSFCIFVTGEQRKLAEDSQT